MKIDNVKIYGLEESIVASGLPMVAEYDSEEFKRLSEIFLHETRDTLTEEEFEKVKKAFSRVIRLAKCQGGESHDCFLCGIVVQMNITAPRYWWPEFQRYHFADIVSSTSTMHRLKSFTEKVIQLSDEEKYDEIEKLLDSHFSKDTNRMLIMTFMQLAYSQKNNIEVLKANLPDGFLQTSRVTTNMRQLKTMLHQRQFHRLNEWREFCKWISSLEVSRILGIVEE